MRASGRECQRRNEKGPPKGPFKWLLYREVYCVTARRALMKPCPWNASWPVLPSSVALWASLVLSCAGPAFGYFCLISAATAAAAARPCCAAGPRVGRGRRGGAARGREHQIEHPTELHHAPGGSRGTAQTWLPGSAVSPPGPLTPDEGVAVIGVRGRDGGVCVANEVSDGSGRRNGDRVARLGGDHDRAGVQGILGVWIERRHLVHVERGVAGGHDHERAARGGVVHRLVERGNEAAVLFTGGLRAEAHVDDVCACAAFVDGSRRIEDRCDHRAEAARAACSALTPMMVASGAFRLSRWHYRRAPR